MLSMFEDNPEPVAHASQIDDAHGERQRKPSAQTVSEPRRAEREVVTQNSQGLGSSSTDGRPQPPKGCSSAGAPTAILVCRAMSSAMAAVSRR